MVPDSRSLLRSLQRASETDNESRSDIDLRFPAATTQLNEALQRIVSMYRRTFRAEPETVRVIEDVADADSDSALAQIQERRLLSTPFLQQQMKEPWKVAPGIWSLDDDPRFKKTLIALLPVFQESFGLHVQHMLLGIGSSEAIRTISRLIQECRDARNAPKIARTWDDVILPGDLAASIRAEVEGFLEGRELYARNRLPWKRGLLFEGEAGSGKTHTVRVIASLYQLSTSVVDSASDIDDVDRILCDGDRLGEQPGPRLIVFEDVDRIVKDDTDAMARFLNALDGYSERDGQLVVATVNSAEKLDPSIRLRPSRFDRIFLFPSPDADTRRRFFDRSLADAGWDKPQLVKATEGFTLAFLKELSLLVLDHQHRGGEPDKATAEAFVNRLRKHMALGRKKIGIREKNE